MTDKYVLGPDIDLDEEVVLDRDGGRITAARAKEIAEEVVEEVSRRGRPSLTGQAMPSPQVMFRVTPELKERAEAAAKASGMTVSELAREAFEKYLAS
ncbi:MAG: hypothetical protein WCP28_19535 [Actinomycetes bacterium]